jgi:hypothetical protein
MTKNVAKLTNLNCATLKITRSLGISENFSISRVSQGGYTVMLCDGALLDKNRRRATRSGGVR